MGAVIRVVFGVMVFLYGATGTAGAASSVEWWQEGGVCKVLASWKTTAYEGMRMRQGDGVYLLYTALETGRRFCGCWGLGGGYRVAADPDDSGHPENRGYLEGTAAHMFGTVRAVIRSRAEYRYFGTPADGWRMRNRLYLRAPRIACAGTPHAFVELFTDAGGRVAEIRPGCGVDRTLPWRFRLTARYLMRLQPETVVHVIGVSLFTLF